MSGYQWIDHGDYWEFSAPQGDPKWLEVRLGRTTTSVSGAMANRSRFKTAEEQGKIIAGVETEHFTKEQLDHMGHGTNTEPEARDWYIALSKYTIVERGLIVPKWDLRLGASVDGDILGTEGIIEIKCPVKMYWPLEQYLDQQKAGWKPYKGYYKHLWKSHFDQIQHACAVMGKKWCIYIVYCTTDRKIFTQKIPFEPEYWAEHYKTITESYGKYVEPHLDGTYPILPPVS